jgi:hypothetical protein
MYRLLTVVKEPEARETDPRAGEHLVFFYDGHRYAIRRNDIQHIGILSGLSAQMPMESKVICWNTAAHISCVDLRNRSLNSRQDNLTYLFVGSGEIPAAALLVNSPEPATLESKIVRDVPISRRRRKRVGLTPCLSGVAQVNPYEDVGLIDIDLLLKSRGLPSRPVANASGRNGIPSETLRK